MYIAPDLQSPLAPGLHAFSNAPSGEEWPKVAAAMEHVRSAMEIPSAGALLENLMHFRRRRAGRHRR
jgi:hypothetical protein